MTNTGRKNNQDRIPPHSNDAEQAVLGALLTDKEIFGDVYEIISSATAFYAPQHAKIFDVIFDMYDKQKPVDITTVAEELERLNILDDCGGRTYLSELAGGVASSANAKYYASIVFGKWQLRRTIEASTQTINDCYRQQDEPEEIIDAAEHRIFEIADIKHDDDFVLLSNIMPDTIIRLDEIREAGTGLIGFSTGYHDFDKMTSGLKRGELYILAGRPSMGKSALAMNISENIAGLYPDQAVAFFSVEMTKENLAQRALVGKSEISIRDAIRDDIGEHGWRRLFKAAGQFFGLKIYVTAPSALKPIQMNRMLRRLASREALGLVIVDYLQIMTPDRPKENRQQEITHISSKLKSIAKEYDVPVLVLSQLSRAVEVRGGSHRPQLSDLRESGSIEQDADMVAFIYRPEYYMGDLSRDDERYLQNKGKAEIIIAKQRNGPTGSVWLNFRKEFARFENMASENRFPEPPRYDGKAASAGDEPF